MAPKRRASPRIVPFAVILLAAGESSRMGQPKQLLPWRGLPLVQYHLQELRATTAGEIAVVLGHEAARVRPLVEPSLVDKRVHVVRNDAYREGKTTSIKAGLRALRATPSGVMLLAVDQPRPREVLQRLIDEHLSKGNLISVPRHGNRHGHPPLFDASLIPELLEISEAKQGIREVIERHREALREIEIADPLVVTNLNTPEDYERAKA
ncbi:MAG: nucleotidyltransferase family protein [Chloroflexi bacterium]|nr:nucleotidyltransferase family protein [Chloroflexota bacterium]